MALLRAQVTFRNATSQLPSDVSVNVLHFFTAAAPLAPADLTSVRDQVVNFFTRVPATFSIAVRNILASNVQTTASLRIYNLDDPEPRPPRLTHTFSVAPVGTSSLPNEVALVLTHWNMDAVAVPIRRRRGRLYIGPLSGGNLTVTARGDVRPASVMHQVLAAAGRDLAQDGTATGAPRWAVYSRVLGGMQPVQAVRVDDAFDTQRRRGLGATESTVFAG